MKVKKFALIGAAGYIAKRHVYAIKKLGHKLVLACDVAHNVGYLDSIFPKCDFTTKEKIFFPLLKKKKIDYVVISTPNYLHIRHIKQALDSGCRIICEKPLIIKKKELNYLKLLSKKELKKINIILQLRLNKNLKKIENYIKKLQKPFKSKLEYITSRGNWYNSTWKNVEKLSGGIKFNIGVHLFDILCLIFGSNFTVLDFKKSERKCTGKILFKDFTKLTFKLSINRKDLPNKKIKSYRILKINNKIFNLSESFENLHVKSYKKILNGNGFKIEDLEQTHKILFKLD